MSQVRTVEPVNELGHTMAAPMVPVQRVQSQYVTSMAVQRPRDIVAVEKRVIQEAAKLGDRGYYSWGNGRDRVEGPAKGLSNALMRIYGNCAVDMLPMQETADAWIFTAAAVDLETGYTLTRQFRQSKHWKIHGKFDPERADDMRFQIGQTKATRNVVMNFLPEWLIERGLDAAKGGVREKIEKYIADNGMERAQEYAIGRLDGLGVEESRVLAVFGRAARAALTIEDLVIVAGNIRALETGSDTIESMFPVKETRTTDGPVANPFGGPKRADELAARLAARQQEAAQNGAGRGVAGAEDIESESSDRPGVEPARASECPTPAPPSPRKANGKKRTDQMDGDEFVASLAGP